MNKFSKQIDFEQWSNTMILNALKTLTEDSPRALSLFCHLLNSHSMWLSRVTKTDFKTSLFEERSLDACELMIQENHKNWSTYLSNKTNNDLEETIEFMGAWENPPKKRKMTIEDALIHLINHSSYHRGQIVMHIKGKVALLPLSTYIMYASEIIE